MWQRPELESRLVFGKKRPEHQIQKALSEHKGKLAEDEIWKRVRLKLRLKSVLSKILFPLLIFLAVEGGLWTTLLGKEFMYKDDLAFQSETE